MANCHFSCDEQLNDAQISRLELVVASKGSFVLILCFVTPVCLFTFDVLYVYFGVMTSIIFVASREMQSSSSFRACMFGLKRVASY